MKKDISIAFEGVTLEEAYLKATSAFDCSITDLRSEIIQAPKPGFMGMFKKNAIIKVYHVNESIDDKETSSIKINPNSSNISSQKENFLNENQLSEIKDEINKLFNMLEYDLEPIKVLNHDENTIFIEFKGKDSALLIGKEGYRYKALSYILFNWIQPKYGKMIRLEIAQFLRAQEENMKKYLEPLFEIIEKENRFKTKVFDGILVYIALSQLRTKFPEKYISVKLNESGEKYILITNYRK